MTDKVFMTTGEATEKFFDDTKLHFGKLLLTVIEAKGQEIDGNTATLAFSVLHLANAVTQVSDAIAMASDEISTETFDGLETVSKSLDRFTDTLIDIVKFQNKRDDERRAEDAAYLAEREAEADDE